MNFIFKDKVIAGLRKCPEIVWYFLLAATFFFKDAHSTLEYVKSLAEEYSAAFSETGVADFNVDAFVVITAILVPFVYVLIFELIARLVRNSIVRRFAVAVNQKDFVFRVRLVVMISNVILGFVGITFFFYAPLIRIFTSVFFYIVPTLLFGWFYEDFRKRYVSKTCHASLFAFVSKFYIGIYLIIRTVDMILGLIFRNDSFPVVDTVALCLGPVAVLFSALLAYFNRRRLERISREPEENVIFIKKDDDGNGDAIFKDFGF